MDEQDVALARTAAAAYRAEAGRGGADGDWRRAAEATYLATGGDADAAQQAVLTIVAAVSREHGEWLWGPCRRRLAHEERHLRAIGCWPPPLNPKEWPPIPPLPGVTP